MSGRSKTGGGRGNDGAGGEVVVVNTSWWWCFVALRRDDGPLSPSASSSVAAPAGEPHDDCDETDSLSFPVALVVAVVVVRVAVVGGLAEAESRSAADSTAFAAAASAPWDSFAAPIDSVAVDLSEVKARVVLRLRRMGTVGVDRCRLTPLTGVGVGRTSVAILS